MAFQESETITESKKHDGLTAVSGVGSEQGYITADDILKNCATPEDSINELEEMMDDENVSISTKKKRTKSKQASPETDELDKGDIDDSVKMYLREIGMIKLLKPDEEIDLAKRVAEGCQRDKKHSSMQTFVWLFQSQKNILVKGYYF